MAIDATAASDGHGGRAAKPGPRRLYLGAALTAVLLAVVLVLAIKPDTSTHPVLGRVGHPRPVKVDASRVVPGIGTIPSWLPVPAGGAGHQIVSATPERPVTSASQGDTVRALFGGAVADVTAVGPYVPSSAVQAAGNGQLAVGAVIPVSFRVTFIATRGSLPLGHQVFEIALPTGQALIPAVSPVGAAAIPAELRAGQHLTVKLSARLPGGNGVIRWTPQGHRALITWTYQLELN